MYLYGRVSAYGAMGFQNDPHDGPMELFLSFHSVLHNWFNKGHGMCYPLWEPLLLINEVAAAFHLTLLSPMLYNRK